MSKVWRKKYWHIWDVIEEDEEDLQRLFPGHFTYLEVLKYLYNDGKLITQISDIQKFFTKFHSLYAVSKSGDPVKTAFTMLVHFGDANEYAFFASQLSTANLIKYDVSIGELARRIYFGKEKLSDIVAVRKIRADSLFRELVKLEMINRLETLGNTFELIKLGLKYDYIVYDIDMLRYGNIQELDSFIRSWLVTFHELRALDPDRCRFMLNYLRGKGVNPRLIFEENEYMIDTISKSEKNDLIQTYLVFFDVVPDIKPHHPILVKLYDLYTSQV